MPNYCENFVTIWGPEEVINNIWENLNAEEPKFLGLLRPEPEQ